jgi:ubiquinone/menaquinone biosynthesis C-methylase UbiE
VLDVGTGTGRAALLLAEAGAAVTAVDASDEMLAVARDRARAKRISVQFLAGDAHSLEFPDRSFDVVVSLRVLMHSPRWRTCLGELCRVARHRVIVDYPSVRSPAALQSLWRKMFHAAGGSTEPYRVFSDRRVAEAFHRNSFEVAASHHQFVLPIALHKALGSEAFTRASEGALGRLGLPGLFGSPVTVLARRCASS